MHSRLLREVRKVAELFAWWQAHSFSYCSGVLVGCELDHKEGWVLKNWWFRTVEKTPENPLDCKEIKPVNPKGNQPWIFIRRTGAEAEAPKLWPPDVKSRLIGKDPDAGKEWRQEEKGTAEDEVVGWHHWLDGREFKQIQGDSEGQGNLVCYRPWGHKESDTMNNRTTTAICIS